MDNYSEEVVKYIIYPTVTEIKRTLHYYTVLILSLFQLLPPFIITVYLVIK